MLSRQEFVEVIDRAPLVSIDLIVQNARNEILLGLRDNKPAQGYWFVPGGRVRKNETLEQAFLRLSEIELGLKIPYSKAQLFGAYDHLYDDNVFGDEGVSTHYVALGHRLRLADDVPLNLDDQHSDVRWWTIEDLLKSSAVHENTKAYFKG